MSCSSEVDFTKNYMLLYAVQISCYRYYECYRGREMHAASQQVAVAAVQPASHHRPSFSTSPPMKPASNDAVQLIHPGIHRHSLPRPQPQPQPTTGSLASVCTTTAAGCMIGSLSNPLVGSMRQTGPKATTTQKAATLPSSVLLDADYMHRFRFLYIFC